ncbi:hypothetical protein [Jeotgalibacillus sp. JSM ZJ347]|uniref:hypothetical protein n=1 Tax=Jeotgalibacillus sp. JSM ZJ347 TaxID=3342117 RepID=UPI0035A9A048
MKHFQPSININYDIGKPELFEQFVPNINQLDILSDVISGVTSSTNNTHLLIGPYGAGKSMVGALAASIITARKNSKIVKSFQSNVATVSSEHKASIVEAMDEKTLKWIAAPITGKKGDFSEIILEAIIQVLRNEEISFSLKGDSENILKTISVWKKDFEETFNKFKIYCKRLEVNYEDFLSSIKMGDEHAILEFKKMYSQLTSGAEFISQNSTPFQEQLDHLISQLLSKKVAIMIIFDEFGRFLQTVNQNKIYQTMQDLQDLAETLNRSQNFGSLFITHTGLGQYAASNNNLSVTELERVEKRFKNHRLESDPAIFYRSAFKIIEANREDGGANLFLLKDIEYLKKEILKYNLFPDMSPLEIEGAILEGCQPIHPLAIRLLPALSNVLGQNDRTLYTFLSEVEKYTVETEWYYADQLFNYFYPDESSFYMIEELKYLRTALNYKVSSQALRVIKLMTLLKITNSPLVIDESFISFALGVNNNVAKSLLGELSETKLIRFNRFISSYELFSGSILEFDQLIKEYRSTMVISNQVREAALDRQYTQNYFLPIEYNNAKSMTRFIEAKFIFDRNGLQNIESSDGSLLFLLDDKIDPLSTNVSLNSDLIYCVPNIEIELLKEKVDQFIILNKMFDDPLILEKDANIQTEIEINIENIQYDLQKLLSPIRNFDSSKLTWIYNGQKLAGFNSKEDFESFLSNWMFNEYPSTLEVRNEGFNKHNISSVQKKGALEVLGIILDPSFNGDIEVDGFGPDYLIYATLLKNNHYDYKNLDQLKNPELANMRKVLKEYVDKNKNGKISDIFNLLLDKPFGMREPLVPILAIALLRDYWDKMAFYANDFYVEKMSAELLYQIVEQKVEFYEYEIYQLSDEEELVLKEINNIFFQNELPVQPAIIFGELLNWLRKLSRISQITDHQPSEILQFKSAIRHSETDPLESLKRVQNLLNNEGVKKVLGIKAYLENYSAIFKDEVSRQVMDTLGFERWQDFGNENPHLINKNPTIRIAYEAAQVQEDWLQKLIERTVGTKIEDWSDVTHEAFISSIKQLVKEQDEEGQVTLLSGDQVLFNIEEVELSVKGKTIYNNLSRIVKAGGKTLTQNEVRFILYNLLKDTE